jgi:hypothetical protein
MFSTTKSETETSKVETPSAPARNAKKKEIEEIVNAWFSSRIRNSPVAHHSEGWNHLVKSLPSLIDSLKDI